MRAHESKTSKGWRTALRKSGLAEKRLEEVKGTLEGLMGVDYAYLFSGNRSPQFQILVRINYPKTYEAVKELFRLRYRDIPYQIGQGRTVYLNNTSVPEPTARELEKLDATLARLKRAQFVKSENVAHSLEEGGEIAGKEMIKPATIPRLLKEARFLEDNKGNIFVVSAANAVDKYGKPLQAGYYKVDLQTGKLWRPAFKYLVDNIHWADSLDSDEKLYVSEAAAKVIKDEMEKPMENGKPRLVAFTVHEICSTDARFRVTTNFAESGLVHSQSADEEHGVIVGYGWVVGEKQKQIILAAKSKWVPGELVADGWPVSPAWGR